MMHSPISEISGEAPPLYSDWHTPNERRVDGDRITELVPAREWLSGRVPGNRGPDCNPLVEDPKWNRPPYLPRPEVLLAEGATRFRRDHLHDRNRENAVYDKANPGLATYVRVSRRRCDPFVEQQIAAARAKVRDGEIEKEKVETRLANDMLEARSQSLRKAMADKSRLNSMVADKTWTSKPSTAPGGSRRNDPLAQRCEDLERRLLVMQRMSGLQVQAAAAAGLDPSDPRGHPTRGNKPGGGGSPPANAPMRSQSIGLGGPPDLVTRSGWPVDSYYDGASGAKRPGHRDCTPGVPPSHLPLWMRKINQVAPDKIRDPPNGTRLDWRRDGSFSWGGTGDQLSA